MNDPALFWVGVVMLAIGVPGSIIQARRIIRDHRASTEKTTLERFYGLHRKPAQYRAPCGHLITADDPFDLLIYSLKHPDHCVKIRKEPTP